MVTATSTVGAAGVSERAAADAAGLIGTEPEGADVLSSVLVRVAANECGREWVEIGVVAAMGMGTRVGEVVLKEDGDGGGGRKAEEAAGAGAGAGVESVVAEVMAAAGGVRLRFIRLAGGAEAMKMLSVLIRHWGAVAGSAARSDLGTLTLSLWRSAAASAGMLDAEACTKGAMLEPPKPKLMDVGVAELGAK